MAEKQIYESVEAGQSLIAGENIAGENRVSVAVNTLLDRPLLAGLRLNWELLAWVVLLLVAALLRFVDVGTRAMSHDESLHALYSYYLYDAGKYEHNPMMHGPFLFHANAFMYFLFGDSDVSARLIPVLFGLGCVWMAYFYRRYIGRTGALLAGLFITVSPSLLFHSRYIRDDIYIAFCLLVWVYAAFRYLEERHFKWLVAISLSMVIGILSMEAHFISGAILGAYFAGLALWQATTGEGKLWEKLRYNAAADLAVVMATLVLPFLAPFGYLAGQTVLDWPKLDWNGVATFPTETIVRLAVLVLLMSAISIGIAWYWFGQRKAPEKEQMVASQGGAPLLLDLFGWAQLMGLFWVIAILFYTTFLTNTRNGLATGIVGSLGYWIAQQEVARGGQPWYYYIMLGWLYEFLPMLTSIAGVGTIVYWLFFKQQLNWDPVPTGELATANTSDPAPEPIFTLSPAATRTAFAVFGLWWVIMSWAAYTFAGEKMPWLLLHIALPMCMVGGWWLGRLLHGVDWATARQSRALWLIGLSPALLYLLFNLLMRMPGSSRATDAVTAWPRWLLSLLLAGVLIYATVSWGQRAGWRTTARLFSLGIVSVLFLLTLRYSYMLNYINYDMATEYLVYAHASPDIKRALHEIDMISERTVGARNIVVAYDDESSWPLSWYMRQYPNAKFYGQAPNSDNMSSPVIIVGPKNFEKVHPYVQRDYVKRTYRLVWWPDMDYFNLNWDRLWSAFSDPGQRERIFNIVMYRRYRDQNAEGAWSVRDLSQWPHRHEFELWVKRDIAAQIWDLGVVPQTEPSNSMAAQARANEIDLTATMLYQNSYGNSTLLNPRAVAVGADGKRVIADSGNNRIVVLDKDGNLLTTFGSLCKLSEGAASGCVDPDGSGALPLGAGQFFEPWGIAVDSAGTIFVADTWNGRIQVFDATGKFLRTWGFFNTTNGELGDANALFGPRGIALDAAGNLLVADTGNKRLLHYTPTGELLNQVGGGGVIGGRFEEPTGITVSPVDGSIWVADTWNRRLQKLSPNLEFVAEYPVPSWDDQGIYNKPSIAATANGDIYVTDPQFFRVYSAAGELKAAFGNFGAEPNRFGLPNGIAYDATANGIVIADANNNRVMLFPVAP